LITRPLSLADFLLRLSFFAVAPFVIVIAAELFPVQGVLVDIGIALIVFLANEALARWASRSKFIAWLLGKCLAFERFYRVRPPRPFAYYLFYPLLFPYWLIERRARAEFWMFRGYTAAGFVVLVALLVGQYFYQWAPELDVRAYLPTVGATLLVETLLVLMLLMPLSTTVVWYHSSGRRKRLWVLLLVALSSVGAAFGYVASRRDDIVSFSTRERVRLRTAKAPRRARSALLEGARAAWQATAKLGVQGDGRIEGEPLERARTALRAFYKADEAEAFDLWATPRSRPRILVLYFEARRGKLPIWIAIRADKTEIRSPNELPPGAFRAMRRAVGGSDPLASASLSELGLGEK